ncbi:hypothetical protein B0E43_15560 [Algoriphagus sp. A40]|nr:hypothetical protein B0E43_15560 [Algoriphagus sp. A40]
MVKFKIVDMAICRPKANCIKSNILIFNRFLHCSFWKKQNFPFKYPHFEFFPGSGSGLRDSLSGIFLQKLISGYGILRFTIRFFL